MIRYLVRGSQFWKATAVDDRVEIRRGEVGSDGELEEIDTYETLGTPPAYALDELANPLVEQGYEHAPIPGIEAVIEEAHGVTLPEPVRRFFANGTYWTQQHKRCEQLDCDVDFSTDAVLGNYYEEHFDSERGEARSFVPISGRLYDGFPDEQQWIGIDPEESEPRVYALYTSGEFEVAYESFDAFLDDLS